MRSRAIRKAVGLFLGATFVLTTPAAVIIMSEAPASAGTYCGEPPYNQIIPEGLLGNEFSEACRQHDICYWGGTHGYPYGGNRVACDNAFLSRMNAACQAIYGWVPTTLLLACTGEATIFYGAVRVVGGSYWAGRPADNV